MVGLWPQHDIDERRPRQNLGALRLRHTAGHRQHHASARGLLQPTQPAQFGKHLLGGLVADMAGIEDDHVRTLRLPYRGIAQRRQNVGHTRAVIHVHLATPGDDVQALASWLDALAAFCPGHTNCSA